MYERARKAFLASLAFDEKYMRENGVHPINNWNYTHNLDYLVANCAEEGRYKEAEKYAKMLAAVATDNARIRSTGLGYILYGGHTAMTRLQMRFGMWDAAVAEIERTALKDKESLSARYQTGLLSYLKGMEAVETDKAEDADTHLRQLLTVADTMANTRGENASDWYSGHAGRVLAVHVFDLRGSIASIRGQHDDAAKILAEAADREQNLGYWEPPHYTRPVLESLAAANIRAGKYDEAIAAYERVLKNRPNSGFAYLGIARVQAKKGERAGAAESYKQFESSWANADKDLPQLKEAREWR